MPIPTNKTKEDSVYLEKESMENLQWIPAKEDSVYSENEDDVFSMAMMGENEMDENEVRNAIEGFLKTIG